MPRTKADETSLSSIFREIFESNPDLLRVKNFDEVAKAYEAKYPGKKFTPRERSVAANMKSRVRKMHGISGGRRKARKAKLEATPAVAMTQGKVGRPPTSLLKLEDMIDECLMAARRTDPAALDGVIKYLRAARNKIIHMLGDV